MNSIRFENQATIAERYPEHFRTDWWQRSKIIVGLGASGCAVSCSGLSSSTSPSTVSPTACCRLGRFLRLMVPPDPGSWSRTLIYLHALGETLSIAFLGTLGGALLALPFSLLAARNVVANRIVHFLARRSLDTIRGVDTLIWALIWVSVVGLGPFAGILALICSDFGSFGKLFSEAIETADKKPGRRAFNRRAATISMASGSACCRRSFRSCSARCFTILNRIRGRRPSSASSAPAASASSSPSRSACWNGRGSRS